MKKIETVTPEEIEEDTPEPLDNIRLSSQSILNYEYIFSQLSQISLPKQEGELDKEEAEKAEIDKEEEKRRT